MVNVKIYDKCLAFPKWIPMGQDDTCLISIPGGD